MKKLTPAAVRAAQETISLIVSETGATLFDIKNYPNGAWGIDVWVRGRGWIDGRGQTLDDARIDLLHALAGTTPAPF